MRLVQIPGLRYRDFRYLLAGSVLSALAATGEGVALVWIVLVRTDSPLWVGAALALGQLPGLLLGVPAGILADWLDRRLLLRVLGTALGATYVLAGILLAVDLLELWHLLALTFVAGSLRVLGDPARFSLPYDIVGGRAAVSGLSLIHATERVGGLVGAVMAGSLMQHVGLDAAYFAIAAFELAGVAAYLGMRAPGQAAQHEREPLFENVRALLREVRTNRTLLALLGLTGAAEILGFSFTTALPVLTRDVLHLGPQGLGILGALVSVGGGLVIAFLATKGDTARRGLVYFGGLAALGAAIIGLGASASVAAAAAALLAIGGLTVLSDIMMQALVQASVPNEMRGRAMGGWVFAVGLGPVGQLQMGALAVAFGVGAALVINGGALIALAAAAALLLPRIRRL